MPRVSPPKEPTMAQRRVIRWMMWHQDVSIYWLGGDDERPQFNHWWRAGYGGRKDVPARVAAMGTPRLTVATFHALVRFGWIAPALVQESHLTARVILYRPTQSGIAAVSGVGG